MSTKKKQKRRKRIFIHLKNDNINDFDYVIKCLMTLCMHNYYQAQQCALLTHNVGKCNITSGFAPEIFHLYSALIGHGLKVELKTK